MQILLIAIDGAPDLHASEIDTVLPYQLDGMSLRIASEVIKLDKDTTQSDILTAASHVRNEARKAQATPYSRPMHWYDAQGEQLKRDAMGQRVSRIMADRRTWADYEASVSGR